MAVVKEKPNNPSSDVMDKTMKPNRQKTDWEGLWDWCCTEVMRLDNGKDVWKQINKVMKFAIKSKQQEKIERVKGLKIRKELEQNEIIGKDAIVHNNAISDVLKIMEEK